MRFYTTIMGIPLFYDKDIGAIIFSIETIPSYILTVANIINEVDWFQIKNGIVSRKKDQQ